MTLTRQNDFTLTSASITTEQAGRITAPATVHKRQHDVLAVHWHL